MYSLLELKCFIISDEKLEFHWEEELAKQLNVNRLDSVRPKIPMKEFVNEALNDIIQVYVYKKIFKLCKSNQK